MNSLNKNEVLNGADVIKLPAKGKAFSEANITVAAELMKNHQLASPLDPTGNIEIAQDDQGWPMIFTIGTDQKFYLMKQDSVTAGGYQVITLSDSLGTGLKAVAFSMTQDNKGSISVNLAMEKQDGSGTTVFSAPQLSNNFEETNWANFSSIAHKTEGINTQFKVERMLMSAGDDGKPPVSIVAGNLKGFKYYYLLDGKGKASKYEFPEDIQQHPDALKDISIGYAFGQTGIFYIYNIGDTQTLACTTIAEAQQGSLSYDYSPGNPKIPQPFRNLSINCISTPTGSKTKAIQICSDIFIGSPTGVYFFKNTAVNQCHVVTDKIKDVHELTIRQDKDSIVVWASAAGNKLYYIYGKKVKTEVQGQGGRKIKDEIYEWNDPVLFKTDVTHIAPIRNTTREGNELYLVTADRSIQHYWQDSATTLWKQQVINVPEQNDVLEFNSFTTHLHFEDAKGRSLINEKVQITASEWTYVTINGYVYSLDQGSSAEVSTDIMGNVTIINMADDISCAVYHLTADWLDKTLNIYSNAKITRGLASIKSADDLKNARTEDGKPVLTASYDDDTLNAVAGNISQLADKGHELKSGNSNHNGYRAGNAADQYTFTAVENKGVLHTGRLTLNKLPDNFMLSYGNTSALPMLGVGGIFDDLKHFAGDALHYLTDFVDSAIGAIKKGYIELKNGISFILEKIGDGLRFVLAIGDKILNIMLDTLGAVFKALNWVLKLIGIDLEKILEWLGKLLGWTDILETSDKLCELINNGFDIVAGTADVVSDKIADIFRDIEVAIAGEDIVNKLGDVGRSNRTDGRVAPLQDPAANLGNYHLIHGKPSSTGQSSQDGVAEAIERAFKDLIENGLMTGEKAISMIGDLFSNITTDTIGETVTRLLQILAVTVLEEIKHGAVALMSLAKVLIEAIKAAANYKMNIPILGSVLKPLLGGRELTVLRVSSIMIALPLRIIYKLATGDSFPHQELSPIDVNVLNAMLKRGPKALPKSTANVMGSKNLLADQKEAYQVSGLITFGYELTRTVEIMCSTIELFDYLTNPSDEIEGEIWDGPKLFSGMKTLCAFMATVFDHFNLLDISLKSNDGKYEVPSLTNYQWAYLSLTSVKTVASVAAKRAPARFRSGFRGLSLTISAVLAGILCTDFAKQEKNRPNNLRFTSNLFQNLYKMISDFPVKVPVPAAVGICAANAVTGLTHVALVAGRSFTDKQDNVTFSIV
jgi:hypothetical protein